MSSLPPTSFDLLMQQLSTLPLWVKQVITAQLRHELEATMSKSTLEAFGPEHTLQLMVPELTRQGIQELEQPSGQVAQGVLKMLYLARYHKNVLNIAIMNNWTLEQCALYLIQCLERTLIVQPKSGVVAATIDYLGGKTRLGEYLVKINRLTVEQLDQALRTQKYIEESMGERTGIANVLINLGYIKKEDSEGILFLKEESKKPYPNIQMPGSPAQNEALMKAQSQLNQAMQRIRELETMNHQLQKRP